MNFISATKTLVIQLNGRLPTDNEAREIGKGRKLAREVIDALRAEKLPPDTLMASIHIVRQEGGDSFIGFFREIQGALEQS